MAATELPLRRVPEWPRSTTELEREWGHMANRVRRLTELEAVAADGLGPEAHCLLGMRAAAQWALGTSSTAPMTGGVEEPTFCVALDEMDAAETLIQTGAPGWAWAVGVHRWLSWLIGAEESVRYPRIEARE
jgi:hypothetical protein